jgi:hypothetical protein
MHQILEFSGQDVLLSLLLTCCGLSPHKLLAWIIIYVVKQTNQTDLYPMLKGCLI